VVHLLVNGSATTDLGQLSASGFVLGLPSVKPAPWDRKSYPLDRGIRALRGGNWACLLLAEPVPETHVNKERDAVIEELKDIPEVNRTTTELPDLRPSLRRPTNASRWRIPQYRKGVIPG
jgi:hypothetical protein